MTRSRGPFDQYQDWQQQPEADEKAHTPKPATRRPQGQQPEPHQQYPAEPSFGGNLPDQQRYQDQQFAEPSLSQPAHPYNNPGYPGGQAYPDQAVEHPYAPQEQIPSQGAEQFHAHDGNPAAHDYQPQQPAIGGDYPSTPNTIDSSNCTILARASMQNKVSIGHFLYDLQGILNLTP